MADLCLRQGHRDEALAIYRRLLTRAADAATRERISRRIATLEPQATPDPRNKAPDDPTPLPIPGVRTRWAGDDLTIEWRLPPDTRHPGLEVLLVKRGPQGVVTETRAIAVDDATGRIDLTVSGLHLARVAAGFRQGPRFVPVARG